VQKQELRQLLFKTASCKQKFVEICSSTAVRAAVESINKTQACCAVHAIIAI
jgi:hypothetical protein